MKKKHGLINPSMIANLLQKEVRNFLDKQDKEIERIIEKVAEYNYDFDWSNYVIEVDAIVKLTKKD
jgi:predicted transcriptional regulator